MEDAFSDSAHTNKTKSKAATFFVISLTANASFQFHVSWLVLTH
jgi:hypothetical protein